MCARVRGRAAAVLGNDVPACRLHILGQRAYLTVTPKASSASNGKRQHELAWENPHAKTHASSGGRRQSGRSWAITIRKTSTELANSEAAHRTIVLCWRQARTVYNEG